MDNAFICSGPAALAHLDKKKNYKRCYFKFKISDIYLFKNLYMGEVYIHFLFNNVWIFVTFFVSIAILIWKYTDYDKILIFPINNENSKHAYFQ